MSNPPPPRRTGGSQTGSPPLPAQLLTDLQRGFSARLRPLLGETLASAEVELRKRIQDDAPGDEYGDALANLIVLRVDAIRYEQRWHRRVGETFDAWPQPPTQRIERDAYTLVSDDELQSQLVGQPVIEALERRHADILDILDRRLWSLAADLGGQGRPSNPLAPRALIDCLLDTYPADECHPLLRTLLLRHYERLAGAKLVDVYAWCNVQLAQGGHAMSSANERTLMTGSPLGDIVGPMADGSFEAGANPAVAAGGSGRAGAGKAPDAVRGNALRARMRVVREQNATADIGERHELRLEEFLAVLSLLQGEEPDADTADAGMGERLRNGMRRGAADLGMDAESSTPGPAQHDAIDLVGALFDELRGQQDLSPQAQQSLARLAPPWLRLALGDAYLFDNRAHPAMEVLSTLVMLWDANPAASAAEAELHALADAIAADIAENYNGNDQVLTQAWSRLEEALEPIRRRAEIAERRVWQALQGRERLSMARREADRRLCALIQGRPLLPAVADFLGNQWRQSLVQAWLLDDSAESPRFEKAAAVGETIAKLDADAARADGTIVAEGLIALQQPLRDCHVACGLDESGANALLAKLVSELARPDAPREVPAFAPLADDAADTIAGDGGDASVFAVGQIFASDHGATPQSLRLAWRSALSGASLLVDRHGARQLLLSPAEMASMLATRQLRARHRQGPIEGALQAIERDQEISE